MKIPLVNLNVAYYLAEWVKAHPRSLLVLLGFVLLLAADGRAWAQTQLKWDEDQLTWTAPTACSEGSPISDCPVTGYRIERATAQAGPWTLQADVGATVLSYLRADAPPGTSCYRVFTRSAGGLSAPSNVVCVNAVAPLPGAPVLQVVEVTAYDVRFQWRQLAYALRREVGTVPLGTACDARFSVDEHYYAVPSESVMLARRPQSAVIVAACA